MSINIPTTTDFPPMEFPTYPSETTINSPPPPELEIHPEPSDFCVIN